MTAAPFDFPVWVPASWRAAFAPSLLCLWKPPPDPTLPVYWSGGLVAKKLLYAGAIRSRIPHSPPAARQAALRPYLELAATRLVPLQGYKRYVTDCPACDRPAPVLLAPRAREPPFCRRCWPRRFPPHVTLLAALNAHHQLAPLPPNPGLLRAALDAAAAAPLALHALPSLLSPALDPLPHPSRRYPVFLPTWPRSPALDWTRSRRTPTVVDVNVLALLARGLHPVGFFLAPGVTVQGAGVTVPVAVTDRDGVSSGANCCAAAAAA